MKKINWIKGCSHHFFSAWLRYSKIFSKKRRKKLVKILVKQNTFFGWLLAKQHLKKSVKGAKNGFTSYFSKKNWMPFNSLSFFQDFILLEIVVFNHIHHHITGIDLFLAESFGFFYGICQFFHQLLIRFVGWQIKPAKKKAK